MDHATSMYFQRVATGHYAGHAALELNLLHSEGAQTITADFRGQPVVTLLDGLVLDDADTSNHHVLLRRAPLEGHVLFLSHDGETRVVFSSLGALLAAADAALADGIALPELHPALAPVPADQPALNALIQHCVDQDEIEVALALIPSLDLAGHDLLSRLAAHEDFFLAEAVGDEIAKRPDPALATVATLCAAHAHPQARNAGQRALRALRRQGV
jgi:hypothetical protein